MAWSSSVSTPHLRECFQYTSSKCLTNRAPILFLLLITIFLIIIFNMNQTTWWKYSFRNQMVSSHHCLHVSYDSLPHPDKLTDMTLDDLRCIYERHITSLQSLCTDIRRYGNIRYGGFRLCMDREIAPSHGCHIYSFNHDLSQRFLKQMETNFNCKALLFGRNVISAGTGNLRDLNDILASMRKIDIAIMKINQNDFRNVVEFCDLANKLEIKQVIIEIHYDPRTQNKENYRTLLRIFKKFSDSNYQIYWYDRNWICVQQWDSICFTVNMYLYSEKRPQISNKFDLPRIEPIGSKTISREVSDEYESIFWDYISKHQILCKRMIRVGNIQDGGWDICYDETFRPQSPCIVYSIGINYDFSFDDDVQHTFECDVFSFDPSMHLGDHNRTKNIQFYKLGIGEENKEIMFRGKIWKLNTLKTIQEKLGHTNKRIDILKMDIEDNEFHTLPDMIRSGALKNVVQFCLEFHHYFDIGTIRELYEIGFRIYWSHQNPTAEVYRNGQTYSYGNDVYFVNINMAH